MHLIIKSGLVTPVVTAFVLGLSSPAFGQWMRMSQDLGFYAGASVGGSHGRNACDDPGSVGFVGTCEDKGFAWKVLAGYQFTRTLAVELGFVRLGKLEANGTILGIPVTASGRARGFELVGLGIWPLTQEASVFAKFGLFRWRDKIEGTAAGFFPISGKEDGTDVTWGLGAGYKLGKALTARAEWQRYDDVNDTRYDYFGVGLTYHFWP
jgi:OOP family OmpA-OmpF porin